MALWDSTIQNDWNEALAHYNDFLTTPEKAARDALVTTINASIIATFSDAEFRDFLEREFFPWKYTARNRLATTLHSFSAMTATNLHPIKALLVDATLSNDNLLDAAMSIRGLGAAGATALLSILYPNRFGTVDQFVVSDLQASTILAGDAIIHGINPNNIKKREALYIENLFNSKASFLNSLFGVVSWNPRNIDKALWAYGR